MTSSQTAKLLRLFSGIIDLEEDIPKAFLLYQQARRAYVNGDIGEANAIKRLIHILHSSEIPYTCEIGKNSIFAYGGIGVIIHANSKIGERANIGSNVTIGGMNTGVPRIGHDVYIATGAKILGGCVIGDGAIIGANAVITSDVGKFEVWAGIPAKKIGQVDRSNFSKYQSYYWCKNIEEGCLLFLDWYFPGAK